MSIKITDIHPNYYMFWYLSLQSTEVEHKNLFLPSFYHNFPTLNSGRNA